MKKLPLLMVFLIGACHAVISQTKEQKESLEYANKFLGFMETNADSSIYYARLLAGVSKSSKLFESSLHNSFAQTFVQIKEGKERDIERIEHLKPRVEIGLKIITALKADTTKIIRNNISPINYWVSLQQENLDNSKVFTVTNDFIKNELTKNDLYENRAGRYSLLIYQIISQKKELKALADELLTATYNNLKSNQVDGNIDSASRSLLAKRGWYRYLFSYSNFLKGTQAEEDGNDIEATKYFKVAFENSPDLTDKNNSAAYFYDRLLFGQAEDKFENHYLNYLKNTSKDKTKTLAVLSSIARKNPLYRTNLQAYYESNFPDQDSFSTFWMDQINKDLDANPDFTIKLMDGTVFSSSANKGKWILIDFWGTWCAPCRKEHPLLEKFNKEVIARHSSQIMLLTVACKDNEDRVIPYLKQFNYSFPVAMEDKSIVKAFNVKGYPTKILITPQGKYLLVPFGVDWVHFVKAYAGI